MPVTVLTAPQGSAGRLTDPADAVVTITVQISIAGGELPAAAKRLISDLEALAEPAGREALPGGSAMPNPPTTANAPIAPNGPSGVAAPPGRDGDRAKLRLVGGSPRRDSLASDDDHGVADQSVADHAVKVRRIGRVRDGVPSLYLHTGSRMVFRDGAPVQLTRREFDLFQFLCENPRRVFTRSQLLRLVWGYDMVGTERTVDVHVRRLRVKLGECASMLATVRGVGYRLDDEAPVEIVVQED